MFQSKENLTFCSITSTSEHRQPCVFLINVGRLLPCELRLPLRCSRSLLSLCFLLRRPSFGPLFPSFSFSVSCCVFILLPFLAACLLFCASSVLLPALWLSCSFSGLLASCSLLSSSLLARSASAGCPRLARRPLAGACGRGPHRATPPYGMELPPLSPFASSSFFLSRFFCSLALSLSFVFLVFPCLACESCFLAWRANRLSGAGWRIVFPSMADESSFTASSGKSLVQHVRVSRTMQGRKRCVRASPLLRSYFPNRFRNKIICKPT